VALPRLKILAPCAADWESMPGAAHVRHCASCDKDVYNTKSLARAELERLLIARAGQLPCMRIHRRPDGSVITRDDLTPMRRATAWLRLKAAVATSLVVGLVSSLGGGLALAGERAAATPTASAASEPKAPADKARKKKPRKKPDPPKRPPGGDSFDQGLVLPD
jgi:hypothetical protein